MKVAAFGCVNKQQLLRNFLWLSPQQHFRTLFREANFHANFRKAVIEISLFPAIFRSNIRAAFLTVVRIFVLTETIDVLKVRTKFRFTRNFVIFRRKVPKSREKHRNSFAFFLYSTVDESSSYATTFGTPWGRYRWLRMPFGLSPAPEEFQRRIDIALGGLPSQKAIADDILVFGSGDTDEEAFRDHDHHRKGVFNRCQQKGIKLNAEKMRFRQKQVTYMGHVISSEGLGVDPDKLKSIIEMRPPTDKHGVQRILGMVNYVQKFAPNLADVAKPLRDLVKNDITYHLQGD